MIRELPDYQFFMRPILVQLADGRTHAARDVYAQIFKEQQYSDEELQVRLPSGKQTILLNRIGWAKTYLKKAALIESPQTGIIQITQRGMNTLKENVEVNKKYLTQFDEFKEFQNLTNEKHEAEVKEPSTPEEMIADGYQKLKQILQDDLKQKIMQCSPAFFESLVIDLLLAMGYGGSFDDAGKALGRTGDGGVDGVIKEDKLGLDVVYVQAKRWEGSVGRNVVQAFAGSLQGFKANKGVMITTSTYTKDAVDYVKSIHSRIVLVDGDELANLMIEHNIGVKELQKYTLKKVDEDYFDTSF